VSAERKEIAWSALMIHSRCKPPEKESGIQVLTCMQIYDCSIITRKKVRPIKMTLDRIAGIWWERVVLNVGVAVLWVVL